MRPTHSLNGREIRLIHTQSFIHHTQYSPVPKYHNRRALLLRSDGHDRITRLGSSWM